MSGWLKPETRQRLLRLLLSKKLNGALLIGYVAIGVSIALLAPPDILSRYTWARSFVNGMGALIPAIEKLGTFSKLPELAQFHMAVLWALSPAIVVSMTLGSWVQPLHMLEKFFKEARSHRFRTVLMLIVPPFFLMALFGLSPGESPGRQLAAYLGSRSGMAVWTLLVLGIFVFISLWLGMLRVIKPLLNVMFSRKLEGNLNTPSSFTKGE